MDLIDKITSKQAKVAVIGLGYVGLPLVIEFCRAGFHVTGFDIDPEKVELLKQGKSYINHINSELRTLNFLLPPLIAYSAEFGHLFRWKAATCSD